MISLHPHTHVEHDCPRCGVRMDTVGWHMPGMRCLAELRCGGCATEFYGDLPAGQGLYTPMLIERATGFVHDSYGVEWFADWLRDSYARRVHQPIRLRAGTSHNSPTNKPAKRAVLLNCLDALYGHSLLKLLNAQHYLDTRPDLDLLLIVPACLAWMVPAGVHESLVVDLPLRRGTEWNEWLAGEIRRRVERYDECYLSLAFSHPSACDFSIERFTGMKPFPLDEWEARAARPRVTFIWREDRCWSGTEEKWATRLHEVSRRASRLVGKNAKRLAYQEQTSRVIALAEELRVKQSQIIFTVAGIGTLGELPSWIIDERRPEVDEEIERRWCRLYAESHIVVGVHGSNMLLPSAHAGAVVELMPPERWGNILQDIVVPACEGELDPRATMFRRRILSLATTPQEVALILDSMLRLDPGMRLMLTPRFTAHGQFADALRWRFPQRNSRQGERHCPRADDPR